MADSPSKTRIIQRIQDALQRQDPMPFADVDLSGPVFAASDEPLDVLFAQRFGAVGGRFVYAETQAELAASLRDLITAEGWDHVACWDEDLREEWTKAGVPALDSNPDLSKAQAGLARCDALVARTGSILVSSKLAAGRSLPIYPPVQIVVASTDQLVPDIVDALRGLHKRYPNGLPSLINFATGPSRTADIEKTLVLGAHGPRAVYVFLLERG